MNDTERAALVQELGGVMHSLTNDDEALIQLVYTPNDYAEKVLMPIIDRLLADRPEPAADAVERAASAIHRVDVSMFPDYVRHIPARAVYRDRARAALQAAAVEQEMGLPSTKMTGAYEAMMELSMYVGEEEWDSAQRHIRPASRRVSLRDAQAYTVAAYEKERQAKENGDELA